VVTIPTGDTLQTFDSYPGAQDLIQTLVAHGVRAQSLSIVGSDVAVVERVLATVGYGRTALSSAMSGSWLGVLAGLVFVVISPTDVVTGLLRGFRTVVSVDFLCCEDVLLVSVVDVVGPLVAKR